MFLGLYIFILFVSLFMKRDNSDFVVITFTIYSIMFGPFLIYYGYKLWYYSKLEPTEIQEVMLDQVGGSFNRMVRFKINMKIEGQTKRVETNAIFSLHFLGPNLVDEYSSKKALVGYDVKHGVAVVISVAS